VSTALPGPRRRAKRAPPAVIDANPRGHQRKGRLYDPALRRFTTADPYVTEPLNPQGLNRYSYVQNNPMNFTDPSGFDPYYMPMEYIYAQAAQAKRWPRLSRKPKRWQPQKRQRLVPNKNRKQPAVYDADAYS
jgi:RHS repeat-associated protein